MQVIIPVAGNGTRLLPITQTMSKCMVPISNKPLIEWTIDKVRDIADDIILVIRKQQSDVIDYFRDDPQIKFAFQERLLGTADSIKVCENLIKDKFIVINGDEFIQKQDIRKLCKLEPFQIGCFYVKNPEKYGVLTINKNRITSISEKPKSYQHNLVNSGIYLFDKRIFNAINQTQISERGEYELTDSIQILIDSGIPVYSFQLSSWNTISYPWHLLEVNESILREHGSKIGKNVDIRPGAVIEHPVAIGDNSVIGPNCFIRKYSAIGKNCKIGSSVEIKSSVIMDNTFVSHLSFVGDSIIGRNCDIAAGTVFANLKIEGGNVFMNINRKHVDTSRNKLGSIVGDNVKFGVNCTVMPGIRIWPNSRIQPCSIIREDLKE